VTKKILSGHNVLETTLVQIYYQCLLIWVMGSLHLIWLLCTKIQTHLEQWGNSYIATLDLSAIRPSCIQLYMLLDIS